MSVETDLHAKICAALGEAIAALGSVPNGHLYARVMSHVSLDEYNLCIQDMKDLGWIREDHHLLIWIKTEVK